MNANVLGVNYFFQKDYLLFLSISVNTLLFLKQFFIFYCDFLKNVLLYQRELIKQLFHKGE